jgi:alpha-tubulin suppressor-like RCC1 family protein
VPIRGLENAVQIATSDSTLCGVLPSGTVACLGPSFPISNDEKWRERKSASPVPGFDDVVRVALSTDQLCAITRAGGVRCKRACYPRDDCAATDVTDLSEVTELGVSNKCACALRRDGSLWCWGARYCMGLPGSGEAVAPVHLVVGKDAIREAEAPLDAGVLLDAGALPSTAP